MSELGWYLIGFGVLMLAAVLLALAMCRAAAHGDRQTVEPDTYRTTQGRCMVVDAERRVDVRLRPGGATARIRPRR